MRSLVLLCALLVAGCAPKNAVLFTCESVPLAVAHTERCTATAAIVDKPTATFFTARAFHRTATLKGTMSVHKGTVRMSFLDAARLPQHLDVTAGTPATLALDLSVNLSRQDIALSFEPVGGAAQGFSAAVELAIR